MARKIWIGMIWFMRRPRVKRMRRRAWEMWPPPWDEKIKRSIHGQDRWARKYGLTIMTAMTAFMMGILLFSSAYYAAILLIQTGVIPVEE